MNKLKTFLFDHFHILFKSAADNHLRIQKIIKESNGSYNLTLHFDSYSDLKSYQKKVRRASIGLSSATAMIIVAFIISPYITNPNRSSAANFQWMQTDWSGGIATSGATKTGWTKYASKDASIVLNQDGDLNLSSQIEVGTIEKSKDELNGTSSEAGIYVVDNGNSTATVYAKKKLGLSCTENAQCQSGMCRSGFCGCFDTSINFGGLTYGVVAVGNNCWLDRNLGATRVATAYNDAQAYGWLYQLGRATDGHQIVTSATTSNQSTTDVPGHSNFITNNNGWRNPLNLNLWKGVNGINNPCPSGYRIPTYVELQSVRPAMTWTQSTEAGIIKLTATGFRYVEQHSCDQYWDENNGYICANTFLGYFDGIYRRGQWGYYAIEKTYGDFGIGDMIVETNWGLSSSDYNPYIPIEKASGFAVRCIKN